MIVLICVDYYYFWFNYVGFFMLVKNILYDNFLIVLIVLCLLCMMFGTFFSLSNSCRNSISR